MDNELKNKILQTGTTIIGVATKDAVVIGADKRVTYGGMFIAHKRFDKTFLITDKIAVATAGNVSDVQLLLKIVQAELKLKQLRTRAEPTVKQAANLLATLTYENIRKLSPLIAITAFLVGGRDNRGSWLYDIGVDGSVAEHKDFVSVGSGSVVAYGVLESGYSKDMTKDQAVQLVIKALNAAMQRDTATGSGLDIVVIDTKKAQKVLEEEIEMIAKEVKRE
ncbi:MAG: proteasome subunit beta [Candidatus Pacearchaeota archaeon]